MLRGMEGTRERERGKKAEVGENRQADGCAVRAVVRLF